jgi:ankyrin repeat protein
MLEFDLQSGRTALIIAVMHGHADCVRLLIDAGADKDAKDMVRRRSLICCCAFSFLFLFSPLCCLSVRIEMLCYHNSSPLL